MREVVFIKIVKNPSEKNRDIRQILTEKHLVAGITETECKATYWQGGSVFSHDIKVLRGITFYDRIDEIEKLLPEGTTIIGACPSTYVNPKTERWLNESIR